MQDFLEESIEIEKIVSGGYGLGYLPNGKIAFVKNTLPEEKVLIRYKENKKDFVFGRVLEYKITSPKRITPLCPLFGSCGGCQYQMLSYEDQLSIKESIIRESLSRIGKISPDTLESIIPSPKSFYYRNKGSFQVFNKGEIGFCKPGTTFPFAVPHCYLMEDSINEKIEFFTQPLEKERIEKLKALNIRSNFKGEIIDSSHKRDAFFDEVLGLSFFVDIDTFFQVNRTIIPLWLSYIKEQLSDFLQNQKGKLLLDLFCGVGIIGQFLSPLFEKVIGIEVNKRLIENGKKVLERNNIHNMELLDADASIYGSIHPNPDCIIVNPPRTGLHESLMNSISQFPPQMIIYSSCNPDTFARDLGILVSLGYNLSKIVPFDMFPQTSHTEIVTVLKKK